MSDDQHPSAAARRCPNCADQMTGPFCATCGQRDRSLSVPLREFLMQLAGDLVAFDSRVLSTLRPLLLRPGQLSREFLDGRRARFVPPVRLYLFVSFVVFFVLTFLDVPLLEVRGNVTASDGAEVAFSTELTESQQDTEGAVPASEGGVAETAVAPEPRGGTDAALEEDSFLGRLGERVLERPDEFRKEMAGGLPAVLFLLVPVLAALFALAYRNRGLYYTEHLVVALHCQTAGFLFLGLAQLIDHPTGLPVATKIAQLWIIGYVFLAIRRVYGGRRWVTALRTTGILLSYSVSWVLALMGLTVLLVLID